MTAILRKESDNYGFEPLEADGHLLSGLPLCVLCRLCRLCLSAVESDAIDRGQRHVAPLIAVVASIVCFAP